MRRSVRPPYGQWATGELVAAGTMWRPTARGCRWRWCATLGWPWAPPPGSLAPTKAGWHGTSLVPAAGSERRGQRRWRAGGGLIFAWLFRPGDEPLALRFEQLDDVLAQTEGVVWGHLNASAARARRPAGRKHRGADRGPARLRLGQAWRREALLRRHVTPRPRVIDRLRARLPSWLDESGCYELLDELDALERREVANHNLYILSIVTAIFLPMTLIIGIFGMNVAGLPGIQDPAAFWWVMLSMVLVPVILLVTVRWRRHGWGRSPAGATGRLGT